MYSTEVKEEGSSLSLKILRAFFFFLHRSNLQNIYGYLSNSTDVLRGSCHIISSFVVAVVVGRSSWADDWMWALVGATYVVRGLPAITEPCLFRE